MFDSSSSQNIVVLKLMFVSVLCDLVGFVDCKDEECVLKK